MEGSKIAPNIVNRKFFRSLQSGSIVARETYNYVDAKHQIDKYMLCYNQQSIQIGLNGKTPSEFRISA